MDKIDNYKYKTELDALWQDALKALPANSPLRDIISRGYAIEREVVRGSLLFIGMNPSFKEGAWNNGDSTQSVFYNSSASCNANKEETNPFFTAINKFYDDIKCTNKPPFAHHDLLFIRETSQKSVFEWRKDSKLNSFFDRQLEISKQIIKSSNPAMIVVLNAGASVLFRKMFEEEGKEGYDQNKGAYIYIIGNRIPVLFSGMLSGQRALDLGSKESLKWHIEFILK